MQELTALAFCLVCAGALAFTAWKRQKNFRRLPLPPGPRRLPIIGNLLDLPQVHQWERYHEMSQQYGDIMYLEALGQPIIILDTLPLALEMFDKQGSIYSNRPNFPILALMKVDWNFGLLQYGPHWRKHRRAFHRFLNPSALPNFHRIFNEEMPSLLKKLHASPDVFLEHIRFYFGATIMRVSYGFDDVEGNASLIRSAEIVVSASSQSIVPGRFLVNNFPSLRYVPSWFPGASWKKKCEPVIVASEKTHFDSFERAKENLRKAGRGAYPSIVVDLLDEMPEEDCPERRDLELVARSVCATGYIGGADTTVNSATALFHVLAMYPEVQKRAQQEIDSVIGGNRLPLMSDRNNLPYICALIKELGRWYTVVPLGIPHVAAEDAEYNGYMIPKGSFIMANSWAILYNPTLYPDPMEFKPERFLKDGALDPSVLDPGVAGAFGFGRRICPGRGFSHDNLFLAAAGILSVFNISPPKDTSGKSIPLKFEVVSQAITVPVPFKCEIKLRSEAHAELLQ